MKHRATRTFTHAANVFSSPLCRDSPNISRCISMVVIQQSTKPLLPSHFTDGLNCEGWVSNQPIAETLMVSLKMIVGHELVMGDRGGSFTDSIALRIQESYPVGR